MASSRKRPPKPDPADLPLRAALLRSVAQSLASQPGQEPQEQFRPRARRALPRAARVRGQPRAQPAPLLIAFSGGPDSTVLLDLAARLREEGAPGFGALHAVHVHHGLQPEADAWAQHCARECERRAIPFTLCRVQVAPARGLEDAARSARYEALAHEAARIGARLLLTAHNADDRIETFLLQWLRGAGLSGLAGMPAQRPLEAPSGTPVQLVRPLLEIARRQIEQYLARHGLEAVSDPSNADARFARNALRLQVLPALERIRSGYRRSATRSIELVAEAAGILEALGREWLVACTEGAPAQMLRIDRLAQLSAERRPLVLRAWLAECGVPAPSRARLLEALDQALGSAGDGRMLIRIGTQELRRHRGLLCLRPAGREHKPLHASESFYWRGEAEHVVGGWGGVLRFVTAEPGAEAQGTAPAGFDPDWLRERPLEVRARTGGERFKPHALRPSKRLKQLFQEAGVPEFERASLPLLWRDGRLIYVAALGGDARLLEPGPGKVRIEWSGEASLLAEE